MRCLITRSLLFGQDLRAVVDCIEDFRRIRTQVAKDRRLEAQWVGINRNFVVRELPNAGEPLSPEFIAQELDLPVSRVNLILEELEKHLTFLFRNKQGAVTWAYPVTVDRTPHHVTFNTGEQIYAA